MSPDHFKTRPRAAPIDVSLYLERLGVMKELPSLNFLKKIHQAHLRTFPFENLDIHARKPILLDTKKVFEKIVIGNRGGICYELNLLFYQLLIHLGYESHLISARVWDAQLSAFGPEYDHMAMLVKIQREIYLCDVGFGHGFLNPLKMKSTQPQLDSNRFYRIQKDPDGNFEIQLSKDNISFRPVYIFAPKFREPIEFIHRCDHHQSAESSHLFRKKIVSIFTQRGFKELTNDRFEWQDGGENISEEILNGDAFATKMEEHFGLNRILLQKIE